MLDSEFRALVSRVGQFYITDRAMKRAQKKIEATLAAGIPAEGDVDEYLAATRRYFSAFEREARRHLRSVDKRLEHANQVHFNLTAERGVAVRRIEATQAVLQDLDRVASAQTH